MSQGLQIKRTVGLGLLSVGRIIFYGASLCAIGVVIFQLTKWLQDGHWTSLPVTAALLWGGLHLSPTPRMIAFLEWLSRPDSWFGLHALASMLPTVIAFALMALIGMVTCDCGRLLWRGADELLREQRLEPRDRSNGGAIHSTYQSVLSAPGASMAASGRQVTAELAPVERNVLRWLAMNELDSHLAVLEVMLRHLEHRPSDIEDAVSTLVARGFIAYLGGSLKLTERGRSYCIDAGWTMATRRAG